MRIIAAVFLAAMLTLAGCGVEVATSTDEEGSSASPDPTPTTEATTEAPKTATSVAEALQAEIPEISKTVTITEDNDPNDKIGRPGGYVDGAVMFDKRAEPFDDEPGVDQGAFLEVWPDEASATDRAEFIQQALKDNPVLGTEYYYQQGGFLLRVSGVLKPSAAEVYEATFNALF